MTDAAPVASSAASTSSAPSAIASAARPQLVASVATFRKDILDECDDFAITPSPHWDGGVAPDWKQQLVKAMFTDKTQDPTILRKTCAEQFTDRPALATCAVPSTPMGDAGASLTLVGRYYSVATVGRADTYMKQCIQAGGDWKAVPHDSDEYRNALRSDARQNAQTAIDLANKIGAP
jgi:hypothetical protein